MVPNLSFVYMLKIIDKMLIQISIRSTSFNLSKKATNGNIKISLYFLCIIHEFGGVYKSWLKFDVIEISFLFYLFLSKELNDITVNNLIFDQNFKIDKKNTCLLIKIFSLVLLIVCFILWVHCRIILMLQGRSSFRIKYFERLCAFIY